MKKCTKCQIEKSLDDFKKDKTRKDGFRVRCQSCRNKECRDYRKKNIDKLKETDLKRRYGISIKQKHAMLLAQNGCCAICKISIVEYLEQQVYKKCFSIDHDHKTGQIRGLLCDGCNKGIGFLKESKEILQNVNDYLNHYSSIPSEQTNIIPLFKKKG